jgi:hypothetical protein
MSTRAVLPVRNAQMPLPLAHGRPFDRVGTLIANRRSFPWRGRSFAIALQGPVERRPARDCDPQLRCGERVRPIGS